MRSIKIFVRREGNAIQYIEDIVRDVFYKDKSEYVQTHGVRYAPPNVRYYNIFIDICGFKRRLRIINDCSSKEIEQYLFDVFNKVCFITKKDLQECKCRLRDFIQVELSFRCVGERHTKAYLTYEQQLLIYKMSIANKTRRQNISLW